MAAPWRTQNDFYRKHLYNVMQLYRSRPDVRIFTEVILSLSAITVFGIFAIRPTFITIAGLIQEINAKEEIIAQLDQKIANIQLAQETYQQNVDAISLLETSIPSKALPHAFVRQLEAVVAKNSVNLNSLTIENVPVKGESLSSNTSDTPTEVIVPFSSSASEIQFGITISGSFTNIANFIKDLENLRMVTVEDRNTLSTTQAEGTLTVSISGRMPYLKSITQ